MKMKNVFVSSTQLFVILKSFVLCFLVCLSLNVSAQSHDSYSKDLSELKLSSIKSADQLKVVLDDLILSNELVYTSTDTHPYDRVLFELYGVLLKDIKSTIAGTGQEAIQMSFQKIMEGQVLKPEFKIINPNDMLHLATGLVEMLQDIPQVETIQPK